METKYTIVNICPKKTFYSEEDLHKYCETHVVPDANFGYYPKDKFVIEKTVSEVFTLDGMLTDISINKELVADLLHILANNFNQKHINFSLHCTPYNSYYYYSSGEEQYFRNWIIEFLKNIKPEHVVECLDVHTNYKLCNGFAIHVSTYNKDAEEEYLKKYNKDHGTKIKYFCDLPNIDNVISKLCGGSVKPSTIDFSTWTEDELEYYNTIGKCAQMYIQFRNNDIMIDSSYYTGRHVSHRQNIPMGFDKQRYNWCIERINGNFNKHK